MHACTVIAKNYLAHARVLAESFLLHNPGSEFAVLVIDDIDGYFDPDIERFSVVSPDDIGCEPFERLAARYDVLEMSRAVKPWLLRQQLRAGAETITYLDPDIRVYGPLGLLHEEAVRHGLVLTPHSIRPLPDDGKRPSQIDIMIAGVYNVGNISLGHREDIELLIDWWCERVTTDSCLLAERGAFVDQRWFDIAPAFVNDHSIVRHPEYNVGYWNADSRELVLRGGRYFVDGRPLASFHFSGFDPIRPEVLSRYQTRVEIADLPALRQICAEYSDALLAHGYDEARDWPYTYATMADGAAMTRPLRVLYALGDEEGALTESPFQESGCRALLQWASQQDPDAPPGINRALARAYGGRPDLRTVFADLSGASREPFLQWARERGPIELELPESLLPPPRPSVEPPTPSVPAYNERAAPLSAGSSKEPMPQLGANVVGYFRSEVGVGEAARRVVSALDAVATPLLPIHGATIPLSRRHHSFQYLDPSDARYPINLICMNADALPDFADQAGPSFFADRYSIGLWFWEVSAAPPGGWRDAFELLDEVWAPTRHVAEVIGTVSPIPVVQVRIPIEMSHAAPMSRDVLRLRHGFMFMFSFDYLSVFQRKNPLDVIEAYAQAFEIGEDTTLVIKCINHQHDPTNHEKLLRAAHPRPDIQVIDTYLDPHVNDSLTATCDCYVSLHRSEGFGLTMAEAMYQGKPVIATGYSGNMDFMTAANSYLIDYELVPIGPDAEPYPADGNWAQPDVAQASATMRQIFDDREASRNRGALAAASLRETHSARAAGETMKRRLVRIYESFTTQSRAGPVERSLRQTVERGPVAPPRSSAGLAGPWLRNAILRLVKPLAAYQAMVNDQLLDSIEALDRELRHLSRAQQRSEATDLAQARGASRKFADVRHELTDLRRELSDVRQGTDALADRRSPTVERTNDPSVD